MKNGGWSRFAAFYLFYQQLDGVVQRLAADVSETNGAVAVEEIERRPAGDVVELQNGGVDTAGPPGAPGDSFPGHGLPQALSVRVAVDAEDDKRPGLVL